MEQQSLGLGHRVQETGGDIVENHASDEVQAILKSSTKELSARGYAFVAFAMHLPSDGSPPVFAYNVTGGSRAVADVLREAADLLDNISTAVEAVCPHAEVVN